MGVLGGGKSWGRAALRCVCCLKHYTHASHAHTRPPPRLLDVLDTFKPVVWEYSRLNITNTVMSKRKLNRLVTEGHVDVSAEEEVTFLGDGWAYTYTCCSLHYHKHIISTQPRPPTPGLGRPPPPHPGRPAAARRDARGRQRLLQGDRDHAVRRLGAVRGGWRRPLSGIVGFGPSCSNQQRTTKQPTEPAEPTAPTASNANVIPYHKLEHHVRAHLDATSSRALAVLRPLKVGRMQGQLVGAIGLAACSLVMNPAVDTKPPPAQFSNITPPPRPPGRHHQPPRGPLRGGAGAALPRPRGQRLRGGWDLVAAVW